MLVRPQGHLQRPHRQCRVVKTGEQIMLGGNESYVALCRRHWAEGKLEE